ncbi:heat-shock protein Hsp20 [Paraburkholderia ginsengiterrae]|uniref:Heat-shock protein Hsp20 n=1 Tax=Paraburkholderia ginsengiterrae TaxID=1462993 RepID=A0A1A9MZP8_9BURK|nr:Hsp20/alpha crystallin family protein [Paraburkholderia ginsengiterrae]OAJ53503.1 heat-shock protein Hsp20 [Paraburkholderia ginsengiterrae]OAJ59055.1 heat-shock protein Hsp20 [Paraburkholderia ginsengiterrae]
MSNLTRYDPFMDPIPELFHGLFRPFKGLSVAEEPDLSPIKIDVAESDTAYSVKAELPGIDRNNIDVQIEGSAVTINAKVERSKEQKEGERVIRRERYSGSFSRSFTLASVIDECKATAEYKDGVLSLTLPKKASSDRKRIEIN